MCGGQLTTECWGLLFIGRGAGGWGMVGVGRRCVYGRWQVWRWNEGSRGAV